MSTSNFGAHTQTLTYKLARLPKKSGGVRYEPGDPTQPLFTTALYVEQAFLKTLTGNGNFPQILTLTVEVA